MNKWFKERSPQEKWMMALIVMLLIGIAVRWTWVKKEAGDAFRHRLEHLKKPAVTDTVPTNPDSVSDVHWPTSPPPEPCGSDGRKTP